MRRERVSERFSFARVRVICIYADEEILSAFFSLSFFEREEGLCAKFYARRQRRKREGGMGLRALGLCSGAFFARDDESRSGMIDGGLSSVSVFRLSFFCVFLSFGRWGPLSLSLLFFGFLYVLTDSFLSLIEQTDTATRPDRTRSASSDFRAAS